MKPRIKEVIVVEGRYDRNALAQVVDATVVETGGFSVFNNREKLAFLRRLAEKRGLILLTDPDVEGMRPEVLLEALRRCGATFQGEEAPVRNAELTKADMMEKGLVGPGSAARRQQVLKELELPEHLTANGLLEAMNLLLSREEFDRL